MDKERSKQRALGALTAVCAAALAGAAPALAQDAGTPYTGTVAADPNPYYLGVSQGFTHDSNVYQVPSGPSDTYSSTSIFGGFNQPISRQRVFGRANVSLHRYQDESQLDNTSYDLGVGANLATIQNISGDVNLGLNRRLAAPAATAGVPTPVRNVAQTEHANVRVRWGGVSLLTLEGSAGYRRLDYSAPAYVSSESRQTTGSLGLFYRPGAFLRVGVAGRFDRTRTPQAVLDPVSGNFQGNTTNGKNLDLLADYTFSSLLSTNARLSYTRQTNSMVSGADFSGLTGSLLVIYRPGGRTTVLLDAARNAGFEATTGTRYAAVQVGTGVELTPVTALFENNRITDSVGLGATYSATAKISASGALRYTRARLISATGAAAGTTSESLDVVKSASLGINYEITRAWGASCNVSHEDRDVSGAVVYSYKANTVGCATQFVWR